MSVLIKGMEMPTSPVLFCIHPDGKVFADLEGRWREYQAVPVPEHGRLIDADAFRTANGLGEDCESCRQNTRTCNYDVCLSRMDVCGWVDDAPIIIPADKEGEG